MYIVSVTKLLHKLQFRKPLHLNDGEIILMSSASNKQLNTVLMHRLNDRNSILDTTRLFRVMQCCVLGISHLHSVN